MVLEGAMVSIACICLTVLHPFLLVGKNWKIEHWLTRVQSRTEIIETVSV